MAHFQSDLLVIILIQFLATGHRQSHRHSEKCLMELIRSSPVGVEEEELHRRLENIRYYYTTSWNPILYLQHKKKLPTTFIK